MIIRKQIARYGTIPGSEIVVVGAGCATGAHTWEGCKFSYASINLLELSSNGAVYSSEIAHKTGKWAITAEPENLLLDIRAIRQSRFYRRSSFISRPTSRIAKTAVFHANRDITITQRGQIQY
jgi:hypothetical protein